MVEPPVTVSRGLCLAASHDISYDSLFTAMELSPVKPWLVDSLFTVLVSSAVKPRLDKHTKVLTCKKIVFMCDPYLHDFPVVRTLVHHPDSLQNTIHTAHDLT